MAAGAKGVAIMGIQKKFSLFAKQLQICKNNENKKRKKF
jgi:hypothetical protein